VAAEWLTTRQRLALPLAGRARGRKDGWRGRRTPSTDSDPETAGRGRQGIARLRPCARACPCGPLRLLRGSRRDRPRQQGVLRRRRKKHGPRATVFASRVRFLCREANDCLALRRSRYHDLETGDWISLSTGKSGEACLNIMRAVAEVLASLAEEGSIVGRLDRRLGPTPVSPAWTSSAIRFLRRPIQSIARSFAST